MCSHNHDCDDQGCGGSSLWSAINHAAVRCLNAADSDAAARILRPWEERRLRDVELCSQEGDPELLLTIPFTRSVRLTGIVVSGGGSGSSPAEMRAYVNREVDFGVAHDAAPLQAWSLVDDTRGDVEYATRVARFTGVSSLTLHFPTNGGADATRICFVGLRGTASAENREALVNVVYEVTPRPSDHKAPADELRNRMQTM